MKKGVIFVSENLTNKENEKFNSNKISKSRKHR